MTLETLPSENWISTKVGFLRVAVFRPEAVGLDAFVKPARGEERAARVVEKGAKARA